MSKSTKMIAALGIVAGLGVAALPLGAVSAETVTNSGSSPQTEDVTLNLNVTDGVSIALDNQALTRNESGFITTVGATSDLATINENAVAGGPIVYSNTGTKVTAASSTGFNVTVLPTALTGQTDDTASIPWSGSAIKQNVSGYNIRYFTAANSEAAASLVTEAATAPESPATAYTGGTKILSSENSATSNVYTAYDFAVKETLKAQHYEGTVTYIVQTGA